MQNQYGVAGQEWNRRVNVAAAPYDPTSSLEVVVKRNCRSDAQFPGVDKINPPFHNLFHLRNVRIFHIDCVYEAVILNPVSGFGIPYFGIFFYATV